MDKLFTKARLVTTAVLAVSTLVMSLFVSAPAAESFNCPQLKDGDRFKVSGFSAVYLVSQNKRLYFPNAEVYFSWYSDFSGITTIDQICVDAYQGGGGVNYRPGSRLVKTAISPSVFLIEPNNIKRKISTEEMAKALYGPKWNLLVRHISDAQDSNMDVGSEVKILSLLDGADGLIVAQADVDFPNYYFVDDGVLRKIVGTLPAPLSGDVRILSSSLFQTAPISDQTITPAEILADPAQGGIVVGGQTPAPQTPVQTPAPTQTQTDLISAFTVTNPATKFTNFETAISYGSVAYPWNPSEVVLSESQNSMLFTAYTWKSGDQSHAFVWEVDTQKPEFTAVRAQSIANTAIFGSDMSGTLNLNDFHRGKWVMVFVFARNNDGISGVPGMSVEVDDIAVARIYVPAKATAAPVVTGPNLSLAPSFVAPTASQVLTAYPRLAELKFSTLTNAKHYEVEVYCDYCGASLWAGSADKYTVTQPSSGYGMVTTRALAGDNQFRARTRAVYVDKVTAEYKYGAWSEYRYFSFKTSVAPAPRPSASMGEISLTDLKALNPKTVDFEDATGEVITKYVSLYGVTIWSNNGKAIYVNDYNRGGAKTSSGAYSLFNDGTYPKTSYSDPLFLGFNTPVKAFGFYLVGGANSYGIQPEATITVYGPQYSVIGTFKRRVLDSTTAYFGFQSSELIYKVDIDYGPTYIGESIDDLMVVR